MPAGTFMQWERGHERREPSAWPSSTCQPRRLLRRDLAWATTQTRWRWIAADVTAWEPSRTCDVWHDRAALNFLTDLGVHRRSFSSAPSGAGKTA